jgi:hypothetical protein
MKLFARLFFPSIFAVALFAPACQSVSVPEWPYAKEAAEAAAPGDGASGDAADGGGSAAATGTPLACDGALCDTTNYTACNISNDPQESRAAGPISLLLIVGGIGLARGRTRRERERAR